MDSDETVDRGKTALIPVREQKVDFYGDSISAAQLRDGTAPAPLRPICEALGLNWSGQRQRAQRDPVLREALSECIMHTEPGPRAMLCLPLDLLPGRLFGVTTGKMAPDLAARITLYRRECFRVLWEAFKSDILPIAPPTGDVSGARLALEVAEAVANLARRQLALEERFDTMAGWLRGFAQETAPISNRPTSGLARSNYAWIRRTSSPRNRPPNWPSRSRTSASAWPVKATVRATRRCTASCTGAIVCRATRTCRRPGWPRCRPGWEPGTRN